MDGKRNHRRYIRGIILELLIQCRKGTVKNNSISNDIKKEEIKEEVWLSLVKEHMQPRLVCSCITKWWKWLPASMPYIERKQRSYIRNIILQLLKQCRKDTVKDNLTSNDIKKEETKQEKVLQITRLICSCTTKWWKWLPVDIPYPTQWPSVSSRRWAISQTPFYQTSNYFSKDDRD